MSNTANKEQAEFWSRLAPTWLDLEEQLEEVSGPPGLLAMERMSLSAGQKVVDVGCGPGTTTRELAKRVNPGGKVLGVDIAPEMLVGARRTAERLRISNVEFLEADVQVDDLGTARFDAAYSRFGVMFFGEPVAAFANVRRALRPEGILAFACWQDVFHNDWMLVPGAAAMSVTGSLPLPGPEEPGPFSLADPERVRSLLAAAGFSAIEVEPHDDVITSSEDRIPELVLRSTRVGVAREALQDVDEATHERVVEAIEGAFRGRVEEGQLRISRGFLIVTARG